MALRGLPAQRNADRRNMAIRKAGAPRDSIGCDQLSRAGAGFNKPLSSRPF